MKLRPAPTAQDALRRLLLPGKARAEDLLDVLSPSFWRNRQSTPLRETRLAALMAFFAATGATDTEMPEVRTVDWAAGESGWIVLRGARHRDHRKLPLMQAAAQAIARYDAEAAKVRKCDRLFVHDDGTPLTVYDMYSLLTAQKRRLGKPLRLPRRMRQVFAQCAEAAGDPALWRALTGRKPFRGRSTQGRIPAPATLRIFLSKAHPLGGLGRTSRSWKGPAERTVVPFPRLSQQARADIAACGRGDPYPAELNRAVAAALAAGKTRRETAAHYGIGLFYVSELSAGRRPRCNPLMRRRENLRLLTEVVAANPDATRPELRRLMTERGVPVSDNMIGDFLRKNGIAKRRMPVAVKPLKLDGQEAALRAKLRASPGIDLTRLAEWLAGRGIDVGITTIKTFLGRRLGVALKRDPRNPETAVEKLVPEIVERMRAKPRSTWPDLADWVRVQHGVKAAATTVYQAVARAGFTKDSANGRVLTAG